MKNLVAGILVLAVSSCGTSTQSQDHGSELSAAQAESITIIGQDASALYHVMEKSGLVVDKAIESVSTHIAAKTISCSFNFSSGSSFCSFVQSGALPKTIRTADAKTVMDVLARAGVPKLFQFEGGRYKVTSVSCIADNFDGLKTYRCSFVPAKK